MSQKPIVAIAGASGTLGKLITKSFLLPKFRERFEKVVVLSRSISDTINEFAASGATPRTYSTVTLSEVLKDVDVLINAIGPSGHKFKEQLLRALPNTSVKLYIPSEFGVNHYIHDFPNEEWNSKKKHFQLSQELVPNIVVCRVYAGLFLTESIGPWFAFDTKHGIYEAVGSASQQTTYTDMADVGKALSVLASLPIDKIPKEVYLSGDNKSFSEIAQIMEQHGAGKIEVKSINLPQYKAKVIASGTPALEDHLRFLMGEGKIDHRVEALGCHSELVNPGGTLWKWKSMEDLAIETGGKPWAEIDWKPHV